MEARAINARLRRGETPSPEELAWFARGLASGAVTDAQAGAFAMAVCLRGLGEPGRVLVGGFVEAASRGSGGSGGGGGDSGEGGGGGCGGAAHALLAHRDGDA